MNRKLASLVMMGALMLGSGYNESDSKGIRETHERSKFKKRIIPKSIHFPAKLLTKAAPIRT